MSELSPTRTYESALRKRQARATRQAVIDSARALFLEQGYILTTITQIANRAGVSKPTVFAAAGNKQELLRLVCDVSVAGDITPLPIAARPAAQRISAEPDPREAVTLLAGLIIGIMSGYHAIDAVLVGAASAGDPGADEIWRANEAQREAAATLWADSLVGKTALREGVDRATAIDVLWTFMAPDLYRRFVIQRGWKPEHYRDWLSSVLCQQLLPARSKDRS